MNKTAKYFLVAAAVVIIDQITKLIIKLNMDLGQSESVIGDFFKIQFIENKGAAFGLTVTKIANSLGMDMTEETGKLILTLFSIAAVIAIGVVLFRLGKHKSPLPWFVALIFGGALGNIIDRTFYGLFFSDLNVYTGGLFHGRVVDFFYLDICTCPMPEFLGGGNANLWPIFNIADAAISIGIVVILIFQGRFFKMDEIARGVYEEKKDKKTEEASSSEAKSIENSPVEQPTTNASETAEDAKADSSDPS
ncbi:MAG: signal peptidase II [Bacteroidota bacterium]